MDGWRVKIDSLESIFNRPLAGYRESRDHSRETFSDFTETMRPPSSCPVAIRAGASGS